MTEFELQDLLQVYFNREENSLTRATFTVQVDTGHVNVEQTTACEVERLRDEVDHLDTLLTDALGIIESNLGVLKNLEEDYNYLLNQLKKGEKLL